MSPPRSNDVSLQLLCLSGGRTQFPRGQRCCVKAGASFKKQSKDADKIFFVVFPVVWQMPYGLADVFSNEMKLRNPRATDQETQLNVAHAQLLEKLRPIAFAENLPISNDPVVRISTNLAKKIV